MEIVFYCQSNIGNIYKYDDGGSLISNEKVSVEEYESILKGYITNEELSIVVDNRKKYPVYHIKNKLKTAEIKTVPVVIPAPVKPELVFEDGLEETLNYGFRGLYGEVVTEDTYRLKRIKFIPDLVIDCGANVGIFSRYARTLFPNALIISVEPHKENCEIFKKYTNDEKIILINKAIGVGDIWHSDGAANGSGECYFSEGLGYSKEDMLLSERMSKTDIGCIMIDEVIDTYCKEGMKVLLKLDVEGAENIIWSHEPSMKAIKNIDYICCEIHRYALTATVWQEVQDKTTQALKLLEETHDCELDGVHFYATKK